MAPVFVMNQHAAEADKVSHRDRQRSEDHVVRLKSYVDHAIGTMLVDLRYAVAQLERGVNTDTLSRAFDAFDRAAEVREAFRVLKGGGQ